MKRTVGIIFTLSLVGIVIGVRAQQAGFSRTVLQQADLSIPDRELVTAVATFQAGASSGRHTHPGEEVGYILEGTVVIEQDGKPPVTLEAGKVFLVPPGTPHNAKNSGSGTARILANYIVEKGKPTASPVQ